MAVSGAASRYLLTAARIMIVFARNVFGLQAALLLLLPGLLQAQGTVYLVIGSDTAVWNVAGGVDVTQYRGHFLPDVYTAPNGNGYQVMDPTFRNRFVDSYGQRLKLTWWMMVGSVYLQCDSTDLPIPNLMPLYLMKKYHGEAMTEYGDEVSLHYHTFFWSDYNGDGKYYWNQSRTFHEARQDFDFALAQSLVEENVFPVSFRSGWHYMDNEWQQYLNQLLPFSLHNASPTVHADNVEPYDNVYDWSKAPITFVPFHPSTTNYQIPGDGIGWNVRSIKMPSVSQTTFNQMFVAAANGTNQVVCFWAHLPESDYLTNVARMDTFAHIAASNYPTVKFRYCTAVEAMQRWLGTPDQTPPDLQVTEDVQGESLTLTISTSEPIFQPEPFVAIKDICEQYRIVSCASLGPNTWKAIVPVARNTLAKIGIAVTDLAGNLATRIIRYLPDDLYIDNVDPQYRELSGNWERSTNQVWGTDCRVALLTENDIAQAQWTLPISNSGSYNLFIQVPSVTNAAGNLQFDVYSGSSNALSLFFPSALPGKQWFYLGTCFLDQNTSNSLTLTVNGTNQPGTFAVADVIKLSPLVPPPSGISAVHIDPSDTTANVAWTTTAPTSGFAEYGLDMRYGAFSSTNDAPTAQHVLTLSGLTPNTIYYLQLHGGDEGQCVAQYSFKTTNFSASTLLFDLAKVWKYSTNRLDRTNWQARSFDDSTWRSGPGLLWADVRNGGPNPAVQPKGTPLPINSATAAPFITYYFRAHFDPGAPVTLLSFSNYVDDGAVFYLNGTEIFRLNMPAAPTIISNSTLATATSCGGDATCPILFNISGDLLTNLVSGDNVLAVEVHNSATRNNDITFGSALRFTHPFTPAPPLQVLVSDTLLTLYWNEAGFVLQETEDLSSPANWTDVAGAITNSPYTINRPSLPSSRFFRLRPQ